MTKKRVVRSGDKSMVKIEKIQCIGCGKCVKDCIAQQIILENKKAHVTGDCILCGHCVAICPCNAISIPEYDMDDVEAYNESDFALNSSVLLHNIKYRRSIRNYKKKTVEQEKLENILQAGRYTATAKNNQDCQFIFIQKEIEVLKEMVWNYIDEMEASKNFRISRELLPYVSFNRRRKKDPMDDYLFRNAPAVIFITSDWPLDAGLAAQNMELMAVSQGLGVLYNGFLSRIADVNDDLKAWIGIDGKSIKACLLLGYPNVTYLRTAPRRAANVIWK